MGMDEQAQTPPRSRTRGSKRDALIYGLAGAMLALVFLMALPAADTWYKIVGTCLVAIMAVVYVAKAVIALRQDDGAPSSGSDDTPGHAADVKVLEGATYTVVKRSSPAAGQGSYYWSGDNGQEIELTHDEAGRLS
jgi:hypothetical protein